MSRVAIIGIFKSGDARRNPIIWIISHRRKGVRIKAARPQVSALQLFDRVQFPVRSRVDPGSAQSPPPRAHAANAVSTFTASVKPANASPATEIWP